MCMLDKVWTTNCLQLYKDITFLHLKVLEKFSVLFVVSAATFNEEQLTSINEIPDFRTIWTTVLSPHYSTVNMPEKRFHFFSVTLRKFGTFSGNDCTLQQKRQQTVNVKQVRTINYTLIHFFSSSFKYKNRIQAYFNVNIPIYMNSHRVNEWEKLVFLNKEFQTIQLFDITWAWRKTWFFQPCL
jgi:hypothetical protein